MARGAAQGRCGTLVEIINLNRARKRRAQRAKETEAQENRVRFGRTKAERLGAADERERQRKLLDGHALRERDEQ